LAGYFPHNRSNLCTRHIPHKLTPRGHHDWPVMLVIQEREIAAQDEILQIFYTYTSDGGPE
jgi:hypothetical protein